MNQRKNDGCVGSVAPGSSWWKTSSSMTISLGPGGTPWCADWGVDMRGWLAGRGRAALWTMTISGEVSRKTLDSSVVLLPDVDEVVFGVVSLSLKHSKHI